MGNYTVKNPLKNDNAVDKKGTILIVDDNKSILTTLELLLDGYFQKIVTLSSPNQINSVLAREPAIDLVLLDMNFTAGINTGNEGFYWLEQIKLYDPTIQVVLFTAYGDVDLAVRGIKEGATDFVIKPWDNVKLIATLQSAMNLGNSQKQVKHLKELKRELTDASPMYWGESDMMSELRNVVEKVATTDANVLITGENGTGKEMLAREIHLRSERSDALLVAVDMGAITESLFESELFGHVKGAFTDAKTDRVGKFEVANGGTLFLDEIGNLPYHLQAKLLAALQNRNIVRVGSNVPIPINIRLISATNLDIDEMARESSFREDLLYRINTIHLEIPPLREHPDDILPLARLFLGKYAAKYGKECQNLDPKAEKKLLEAPWPGNIRELQHAIEKAVILSSGKKLMADDFLLSKRETVYRGSRKDKSQGNLTIEQMERKMITDALDKNEGNLSKAALQLGVTRQTLYNKMKRYNL